MKYNVRMFSIKYSKERAKAKKEREKKLQRKMQIAQTQLEQNPCDELKNIFEECKAELENFYEEKANGLIVISLPPDEVSRNHGTAKER